MFPFSTETTGILALICCAFLGALALHATWRWRIGLILMSGAAVAAQIWYLHPLGQWEMLVYLGFIGVCTIAFLSGLALSGVMRMIALPSLLSITVVSLLATSSVGVEVYRQYVPLSCRHTPMPVEIEGQFLRIPSQFGAQVFLSEETLFFEPTRHKREYAKLCRISKNGERRLELRAVWLLPSRWHKVVSRACAADGRPEWCARYDPGVFERVSRIIVAPEVYVARHNSLNWERLRSQDAPQQGDLRDGSVCFPRGDFGYIRCAMWRPIGGDVLVMLNLGFQGEAFSDLTIEGARKKTGQAIDTALSVLSN